MASIKGIPNPKTKSNITTRRFCVNYEPVEQQTIRYRAYVDPGILSVPGDDKIKATINAHNCRWYCNSNGITKT